MLKRNRKLLRSVFFFGQKWRRKVKYDAGVIYVLYAEKEMYCLKTFRRALSKLNFANFLKKINLSITHDMLNKYVCWCYVISVSVTLQCPHGVLLWTFVWRYLDKSVPVWYSLYECAKDYVKATLWRKWIPVWRLYLLVRYDLNAWIMYLNTHTSITHSVYCFICVQSMEINSLL